MKQHIKISKSRLIASLCVAACLLLLQATVYAQDSTAAKKTNESSKKDKPVKNTFASPLLIDDQTVIVPSKGSFEFIMQHRFGSVQNGVKDLWGMYGISDIRLGASYAPINNLYLSTGITKTKMLWDGSAKYSIIKQTTHKIPVSVTYYGNMAYDTREDPNKVLFTYGTQRLSYFNEIMVARKVTDKLSVQVAGSISHQNSVNGYYTVYDSTTKTVFKDQKFDMFAFSVCIRYKLTATTSFIIDYDQPLTKQPTNNPSPNLAFGFEFNTSGHTFQFFAANYTALNPQQNMMYNTNSPFGYTQTNGTKMPGGEYVIGFNITRLWNF